MKKMLDYNSDHPFHLEHEQEGLLLDPTTHDDVDRPIDVPSYSLDEDNQTTFHRRKRILPWMLLIPSLVAYSYTKYYGIDRAPRIIEIPRKESVFKAEEVENIITAKKTVITVLKENRDEGERNMISDKIVFSKDETSSSRHAITVQTSDQKLDSHQVSSFLQQKIIRKRVEFYEFES